MLARWLNNWPQKLGALALAIFLWFFVSTDDSSITQRSLLLPLTVQGLNEDQIAIGVPEQIEVTVSGPSNRVDALRPENFEAVLDLSESSGEFQETIRVFPPQGISLQRSNPQDVIGIIETVSSKTVPVTVAVFGELPAESFLIARAEPTSAIVRGRGEPLSQVVTAVAIIKASENEQTVRLFPADAQGQPVSNITVEPLEATVSFIREAVLHTRRVDLNFQTPEVEPLVIASATLSQSDLLLAGPRDSLATLSRVNATVELDTRQLIEGSYTLELRPQLPSGVTALETPTVNLRLVRPPLSE